MGILQKIEEGTYIYIYSLICLLRLIGCDVFCFELTLDKVSSSSSCVCFLS